MAFPGNLTSNEIRAITEAALGGGMIALPRGLLLDGIPTAFAAGLPVLPAPLDQFMNDLVEINRVERMANGLVPIVTLLQNLAFQLKLRSRPEVVVVEGILNRIANAASGVPSLPDPAALPEVVTPEAIVGEDDMVDLAFLSRGLEVAGIVARIKVPRFESGSPVPASGGGPWVMKGTAWLIAPGLAITNHHVVNARRASEPLAAASDLALQAGNAVLEFNFDSDDSPVVQASVTALVAASQELDYALLEVVGAPVRPIPRIGATRVVHDATSHTVVNIVQHPRGERKRVAFRNNLVTAADQHTLRYFTDTDHGSSGSPVCDDQWRVVALHRGARHVAGVRYLGKDTAHVNFGSQIQAILEAVRATDAPTAERISAAQQG